MEIKSSDNQGKNNSQIITQIISEKGAIWLRLFLTNVNLGNNSTLTITSVLDGATQTLTSRTIKEWKNTTAYFNGDKVIMKLTIAPGEAAIGFTIAELGVGEKDPEVKSQCGSADNRVGSNDAAIGRIVPIGCTGWIISNGRLVTAGHCVGSRAQLIEFNVPKSNSGGSIVHPGPEDQYPIGSFVTDYVRGRPETDWAVFTASANSQTGQTPIQAQRKSFNVVQSAPSSNITITGFGTDTGRDNQTQQTHTGPLSSVNNTFVRYRTDTTGGNSGSPIIDTATGNAIGVHAYGGCSGSSGSNFGERATIPAFWNAMGLVDVPSGPIVRMIKRNAPGFALDGGNGGANAQNVYLWSNNGSNVNQQWIEVDQGSGFYSYVKKGTNFAMDGGNGGANRQNLYLWRYNKNNFNQHWKKVNVGGGHFRLEKRNAPGFSIDGNGGGGNGQNTYLWSSNNNNQNQHWKFITVNPIVRMVKRNAPGFALDGGNGGANTQNVYLWSNSANNVNQQWEEINQGGGFYSYVKKGTNFAMDGGNGGANRQNLYLWTYNKNNFNQHWKKVDVGGGHFRLEKRNAPGFSIDGNGGGGNGQNTYLWSSNNNNQNQHWKFIVAESFANALIEIAFNESVKDDHESVVSVFPNPATNSFSIKLGDNMKNAIATIHSANAMGKAKVQINLQPGVNTISARSLSLGKGIYLIRIYSDQGYITKKLFLN
ncbi:RICIN domain-containing protein [Aquimarina aquimarini]|uniref:RICIN domain-containing protein n=1 Tax=Aquimarina aquimarini TaxID=1191734 RepID=UPI00131F05A5|nr:RICIN domain-containing protein [Aquimarina aquimarini]